MCRVKTFAMFFGLVAGIWAQARPELRPVRVAGSITDTSFAGNLAASVNGTLPPTVTRFPRVWFGGAGYGYYPVYPPLVTYYPSAPVQQVNAPAVVLVQAPPEGPIAPPAQQDSPVRVYSNPVQMEEPTPPKPSAAAAVSGRHDEPLYLIALRDGTAVTAVAYWTDGSDLKYITADRKQKQIGLGQVDIATSRRLNEERGVAFLISGK